jgi:uncharacterized protein (DUF488 family)
VLTVGHSTHPLREFIGLLQAHGVSGIIDIRSIPRSRHNPHFDAKALPLPLHAAGIAYRHMPGLGGLRRSIPGSINTGWRNASFRGFADYMQTPEFERALLKLIEITGSGRWALMCAEALPWRCHRSLVADALVARGINVEHIMNRRLSREHRLTPFARLRSGMITYPAQS